MIYALIALAITQIVTLVVLYRLQHDNSLERQLLLDRIQAGSLQEYKLFTEPPKPKPEKDEVIVHEYV